jgi:hypothetical protein
MKPGKSLERLVTLLEKFLSEADKLTVEAPKRLRDCITGKLREHDVVITIQQEHHELQIAIECRDRSRPVTVDQVEAFDNKCSHTGIDQGIIVSSRGFYNTARQTANWLGIRCLDLEEATSLGWLLAPGMVISNRTAKHTNVTLNIAEEGRKDPTNFSVVDAGGREVTAEILNANINNKFRAMPFDDEEATGPHQMTFVFDGTGLFLCDNDTDERIPLKNLVAKVEYEVTRELVPFQLFKYADKSQSAGIADAAIADIKAGDIVGSIMVIKSEKGRSALVFAPEKESKGGIDLTLCFTPKTTELTTP